MRWRDGGGGIKAEGPDHKGFEAWGQASVFSV